MDRKILVEKIASILGLGGTYFAESALGNIEKKHADLYLRLENAKTLNECREIKYCDIADRNIYEKAQEKIEELIKKEVEDATTFRGCMKIYDMLIFCDDDGDTDFDDCDVSIFQKALLEKAVTFATTIKECEKIIDRDDDRQICNCIELKVSEKIEKLLEVKLETALTFGDYMEVLRDSYSDAVQAKALHKINEILESRLEVATTFKECMKVWKDSPDESIVKSSAIKKALITTENVKDCLFVFKKTEHHSQESCDAIRRMAQIINNKEEK